MPAISPRFALARLARTMATTAATPSLAAAAAAPAITKHVAIPRRGVDYRGKIVLAPMVRSGECPSRLLALKYGADLVWGPETVDRALIGTIRRENPITNTVDFTRMASNGVKQNQNSAVDDAPAPAADPQQRESIIYRLHPAREGSRLIFQLGSADPALAVEAAKLVAADVAGIDVNAGCPKPFSTLGGMGAALLKTPDTLCAILRALVVQVGEPNEIGISVKIRLLQTEEQTRDLVTRLCGTGITGLTVHCRTTPMRPRERAIRGQLKMVADVCRQAGVACLMNGDVGSRDEADELVREYGVDGAMIATAAETNPSVFRAGSDGGLASWEEVVREYVRAALQVDNRWGNTKYLLGQMVPGKLPAYNAVMATKSYCELVKALALDAEMGEMARVADQRLEIGAFEKPKLTKAQRKAALKAQREVAAAKATASEDAAHVKGLEQVSSVTAGIKRSAHVAGLELPPDVARDRGPATVPDQASVLAV